ncbi:MAG TPA: HigA family addiction module antitoxin [Burkholderiales bacterium]|nr:HigA family addiction module antitoxin [Burkholderiales bacterium]
MTYIVLGVIETDMTMAMARTSIHPGGVLGDELEELGVSPTELSCQFRVPANRITQIVNGKRAITGDTALRLAHWFGTSPQFWRNLQALHDVRVAEQEASTEIKSLPTKPAGAKRQADRRPPA